MKTNDPQIDNLLSLPMVECRVQGVKRLSGRGCALYQSRRGDLDVRCKIKDENMGLGKASCEDCPHKLNAAQRQKLARVRNAQAAGKNSRRAA